MKKKLIIIILLCLIVASLYIIYRNVKPAKCGISSESAGISDEAKYDKTVAFSVSRLNDLAVNDYMVLEDGAVLTKISYDDYLNQLAENQKITYDEAKKIDNKSEEVLSDSREPSYYQYKKIFALDETKECKYKVQLEATIKLYCNNSFVQIENVSSIKTSLVSGPYKCEWVQMSVDSYPGINSDDYPTGEIMLIGDGYFKIEYHLPFGITPTWTSETLFMRGSLKCS